MDKRSLKPHLCEKANCEFCGNEFNAVRAELKRGRAKFCSKECVLANKRPFNHEQNCKLCNAIIKVTSKQSNLIHCSRECYSKSQAISKADRELAYIKYCLYCWERITYRKSGNKRTFCCPTCATRYRHDNLHLMPRRPRAKPRSYLQKLKDINIELTQQLLAASKQLLEQSTKEY